MTEVIDVTTPSETSDTNGEAVEAERPLDTIENIFAEVADRAGLDSVADVAKVATAWLNDPTAVDEKGKPINRKVKVAVGQPSPFESGHSVMGIFHEDNEARVYTLPSGGKRGMLEVYTFNVIGVSATAFSDMDSFVDAMAYEYKVLDDNEEFRLNELYPEDADETKTQTGN